MHSIVRITLLFGSLNIINIKTISAKSLNIADVINDINGNAKVNLNVLINLAEINQKTKSNFVEIVKQIKVPQLIINEDQVTLDYLQAIKPLYEKHNSESLTVVGLNRSSLNSSLELLDRILWRRHFKDIVLVYQRDHKERSELFNTQLLQIFEKCWSKGFISVLLWSQGQLYTYHPYPNIKVIHLNNVAQFLDKSHLNNFQQRSCRVPFFDNPNLCYSYTNRHGQLVRTGYFYKWVQLYLKYYNASIEHFFIDMWSPNVSLAKSRRVLSEMDLCMVPIFVRKFGEFLETSNVMYLTKVLLLVPNAKEVSHSLYLVLPFNAFIWFIIIASGFMIFALMYFMARSSKQVMDISKLALQAFSTIIFLSTGFRHEKSLKHFLLHLLFLFMGVFLTNYYSSSLSSLFVSKVYEPQLKYLNDIGRTDLTLLEYSADVNYMLEIDIPKVIKQRVRLGNNTVLFRNRQQLNMTYMYTIHEEHMDYLLFQQYYLKHPIAKKLDQVLYNRGVYLTLPHRSPLIDHFNQYLLRICENGLMQKSKIDTKWDGVLSGNLKIMLDPVVEKPLGLEYLRYGFIIWICGLLCSVVSFVIEYKMFAFKCGKRKS
ncbi:uncharacterized protein LOC135955414 [Calliphora vicina]|uniref:uncharacterized protein LOC135955414 n=1 Tax=Calliphora vicina TaxID=7373 RepID=UPI00325BA2E3